MSRGRDYLGTYRLTRLIRAGQATQVWEAENEADNKRYALKVLQPAFKNNAEELGFLKHEWEVAKDFRHPNVIRLFEMNMKSELPFLVLELANNKNMKIALRESNLIRVAQRIIEQAAEGLFYVHERGWIHRDVKPDNFLVSEEGDVKVIDFTIAERKSTGFNFSKMFKKSKIQGTRSYMSPEQIKGHGLDARADIYSYGCVMFELLGGKAAYTGSTPDELLEKHLKAQVPSLLSVSSEVTPEAANLVSRMMAKDRRQRPDSMWEILKELRGIKLFKPKIGPRTVDPNKASEY
ncbi:MAG TPA: serine/threonine-protein kinase [Pirellulaceae bacterium]|nr:serine/threonine-protein kinase [Pirellulaceae bacterium]